MKLKKLEITGFKSFNGKTSIAFPPGISAIVGPNGCGKSNVMDAIRWVMGEQSVKQLRGKSMEDIIFAGANGNPAVNMAEVSLTLLNDNGSAPEELRDFTEIMLTRRLYRSGERAYFINRQPCRLKDIYNIFYGSGMGPKSYAVIQQGNIGAITEAGPEERRYFIEEAAGITRYKNRKIEALRKVQSTQQNLLRLNDIVSEIQRQMNGLKRQAKKAERYNQYQSRIRDLDIRLCLRHFDGFSQKMTEADQLLSELRDRDVAHISHLKKIDAAVERIKLQREEKHREITSRKSDKLDRERSIDRMETGLAHSRQEVQRLTDEAAALDSARKNLSSKIAGIEEEIRQVQEQRKTLVEETEAVRLRVEERKAQAQAVEEESRRLHQQQESAKAELMELVALEARYKNIFQNASSNKENVQRRLKRVREEEILAGRKMEALQADRQAAEAQTKELADRIESLQQHLERLQEELQELNRKLGKQVKTVQTLEYDRNKLRSRYSALKKMEENFEWYRDGVRAIMTAGGTGTEKASTPNPTGILGLIADILTPEPDCEAALEAALGEALQYILVEDAGDGIACIDYLETKQAGRSGFIPVSSVHPPVPADRLPQGGQQRLLDRVRVKEGFAPVAASLLGHVLLVDDLQQALELHRRNGSYQTLVTMDGHLVSPQGIMTGGSRDKLSGILAKKKEIRDLKASVKRMEEEIQKHRLVQKELESAVQDIETRLHQHVEEKSLCREEQMEAEKELYRIEESRKQAKRHLEVVQLEEEQLRGEAEDLEQEMEKYTRAVADIEKKVQDCQEKVARCTEAIQNVAETMNRHQQQVVDLRMELTAVQAKMESSAHTLRRLQEFGEDSKRQLEQLSQDISLKRSKCEQTRNQIEKDRETLARWYEKIRSLEASLVSDEEDFAAINAQIQESDAKVTEIRSERETLLEKIRLLELDRSEQEIKREGIARKLMEQYGATVAVLRKEMSTSADTEDEEQAPTEKMEHSLSRYREKLSRITDVNLGAIKEYEQLKERFDFLTAQREDLIKALDDLHKVIQKINRITQKRFLDTFHRINEKLAEVFPRLFEGGSAKLVLTEPGNPLETGVEFMVHPAGKKLTRLSLLSGGEKALSAIAFIFSIFLIRPASFCLLDEIDAPLDEANIFRFNNLLQLIGEQSQVIMITHNKRSMEFADTLFGITMEHRGVSRLVSVDLQRAQHLN
ncbi:MAG: chromosome segregation protein SMC [Desulfobacteraceae bacterium]|nr:chromosome segregation protein SMC [Desulfobacteraceae bacterium]